VNGGDGHPIIVLDSSAGILFMRGNPAVELLMAEAEYVVLPVYVLGELLFGVAGASDRHRPKEEAKMHRLLSYCEIARPDAETARVYADLRLALENCGKPIPESDVWIAARARQLGVPLLARDEHFEFVPNLHLIAV
jgi:tRNA(fMet)-specific endonuclease VapC